MIDFPKSARFLTARLTVEAWDAILGDVAAAKELEKALITLLTPPITRRLPLSMQFPVDDGTVSEWIADRTRESWTMCICLRETREIIGLIFVMPPASSVANDGLTIGYFLGEAYWGRGFATEAIQGLIERAPGDKITTWRATVDRDNLASARVLEKAGFKEIVAQSTPGRLYFQFNGQ
jgi:RimJ/RimL family protein N-acetyltransferase